MSLAHNWFPYDSSEPTSADTHGMDEVSIPSLITISSNAFNNGNSSSSLMDTPLMSITFLNENREGINTYPDVANTENLGMIGFIITPANGLLMPGAIHSWCDRFDNAFQILHQDQGNISIPNLLMFFNSHGKCGR